MEKEHDCKRCPSCRSCAELTTYYAFVLTIDEWQPVLLFAFAVVMVGILQDLNPWTYGILAFIAVAPFCVEVVRKEFCARCGIDFRSADKEF